MHGRKLSRKAEAHRQTCFQLVMPDVQARLNVFPRVPVVEESHHGLFKLLKLLEVVLFHSRQPRSLDDTKAR